MKNTIESCRLFCTKDGADKEYQLRLIQVAEGFIVEYSNGRRGGSLKHGVKTAQPVDEATARAEYASVKKSKTKGGYTEDESGQAFVGTEMAGRITGFTPHLLTACEESKARQLIADPAYVVQIKHDGERRYAAFKAGQTIFANRQGLEVPAKEEFAAALRYLGAKGLGDFEFDCEDMGSHLVIFDILSVSGNDLRSRGFTTRFQGANVIKALLQNTEHEGVLQISEILSEVDLKALRLSNQEGVCIKRANAPYIAGRNEDQVKLKFWETATVRVSSPNATKRSVAIEMIEDSGNWVDVGNVTIPANVNTIPRTGDLIEVRYLYAYEGGSLFQPTFERVRGDLTPNDASTSQLKYKQQALAA